MQISPCVGGHLRTWTGDGETKLWSTPDADWLLANQARGRIGRTLREDRRYREVAMLDESTNTLLVMARPITGLGDETIEGLTPLRAGQLPSQRLSPLG